MQLKTREKTIPIHALSRKIDLILAALVEKGKLKRETLPEFAQLTGININTLKKARSYGRITRTNAEKISETANFDIEDDNWMDKSIPPPLRGKAPSDYSGKDTTQNFWFMLRQCNGLSTDLFVRLYSNAPEHLSENLACFNITDTGQTTEFNQEIEILYQIIMDAGYHETGLKFGFSRVRVQLNSEKSSKKIKFTDTETKSSDIELDGCVLVFDGTPHLPRWRLEAGKGILEGEFTSKATSLCAIGGAEIGDKLFAKLLVRPMDGSLQTATGEAMPDSMKRVILEGLFLEKLTEATDGWIVLGLQQLTVVRADS